MALAAGKPFLDYEVDLCVTDVELIRREPLSGRFLNFDKTEGKWQDLSAAAERGCIIPVTVQDRAYKLESLDSEGNFRLVAS